MASSRRNPYDPELPSSHSQYGFPKPLNLGRKIFLSHSGKDKNFVRFLHDKLCQQYHVERLIFFDEKDLPTAECISMTNILIEARGCELGILVLSEDFFTHTANPMLELEALTDNEVRLLPLFYKISVDEFNKMRHQNVCETWWKKWSVVDDGKILKWRHALDFVNRYSGLEYCKLATNELDYIYKIVDAVTCIICPAISFNEEGVCGMDRLCEIVNNMYNNCALMRSSKSCTQVVSKYANDGHQEEGDNTLDLVGIYGFAGLGKSTLCRSLCDFYFTKFHGKVCWIDLGSVPSDETSSQVFSSCAFYIRMQHILFKLAGSINGVYSLTFYQVQAMLRKLISSRMDPIFLAIDNILPNRQSIEEANFYLGCKFPKNSKIFITSRSEKILEQVTDEFTKFSVVIKHIPELVLKEAMNIFVHEIPNLQSLGAKGELEKCVELCIIHQYDRSFDGSHSKYLYHPLMLKSLAASIKHNRRCNRDWKYKVRELQSSAFADKRDPWKMVFKMLDVTYEALSEEEQKVFLDLTIFYRMPFGGIRGKCYAWIHDVYSHLGVKRVDEILLLLEDLSFINCKSNVQMHDLMLDFSKYKLSQGAAGFNPHCLLLEDGAHLQNNPTFELLLANVMSVDKWPSCPPKNVRIVSISGCGRFEKGAHVKLDLRNLEGVQVLHLVDNPGLEEVLLSPTTIASVRSFIVKGPRYTTPSLRCIIDEGWSMPSSTASQGQLVWVELEGNVILDITRRKKGSWWSFFWSSDNSSTATSGFDLKLWPCFWNLRYLSLSYFPLTQSIGLTTITQLKILRLQSLKSLREIHGLERLTNLKDLSISHCDELVVLTIPADLGLSSYICLCRSLQRVSLHYTMTYLEADCGYGQLRIGRCSALRSVDGIAQYMGHFQHFGMVDDITEGCMQEEIQELLGSSKFTATVRHLDLHRHSLQHLAVQDVQHAVFLMSRLNTPKARTNGLSFLKITCRKDGDCGCDKNEPRFGLWPGSKTYGMFSYECPQVRDLSGLSQPGNEIKFLNLSGCKSVKVWPDFAIMTYLSDLVLAHTLLKELPDELLLLPSLHVLRIEGCWQLPVEEMMKAITCKHLGYNCTCGGCLGYNCACSGGSLYSLWEDLRSKRRDRGSVVDVLDSQWPHLVAFFHKQRQYWNDQHKSMKLAFLIFVMYELWFGEVEASYGWPGRECHPSPIMKNMKRLLCSETFMSLIFNSEAKLNLKSMKACMVVALIGSASSGCINALLNEDLKDKIVNFVKYVFDEAPQLPNNAFYNNIYVKYYRYDLPRAGSSFYFDLRVRVREAVRALSEAGELDVNVNYPTNTWFVEERERERERRKMKASFFAEGFINEFGYFYCVYQTIFND